MRMCRIPEGPRPSLIHPSDPAEQRSRGFLSDAVVVVHGKVDALDGAHEADAQPVQQRAVAEHQERPESFPEYLAEGLSPQQCCDTQKHHQRHRYRNHALIGPHTAGSEQCAKQNTRPSVTIPEENRTHAQQHRKEIRIHLIEIGCRHRDGRDVDRQDPRQQNRENTALYAEELRGEKAAETQPQEAQQPQLPGRRDYAADNPPIEHDPGPAQLHLPVGFQVIRHQGIEHVMRKAGVQEAIGVRRQAEAEHPGQTEQQKLPLLCAVPTVPPAFCDSVFPGYGHLVASRYRTDFCSFVYTAHTTTPVKKTQVEKKPGLPLEESSPGIDV